MGFKELNKLAWKIRRIKAFQYKCPVMEISWKHCLEMAKAQIEKKAMKKQAQINKQFRADEIITNCLASLWGVSLVLMVVLTSYAVYLDNLLALPGILIGVGCAGGFVLAMAEKSNISIRRAVRL